MPMWLEVLAWCSLAVAFACALVIVLDILTGHRQQMGAMNVVWPVTALYAGPLALAAYFSVGRQPTKAAAQEARASGAQPPGKRKPPWQATGVAATHCGAGCTLGDIVAGWILVAAPLVLFGKKLYGDWLVEYLFAYALGIAFQYFTIAPMRHLSLGRGLWAAIKADTLSLTAWQVGMYGWMALAVLVIFRQPLKHTDPVYWFMMQLGMIAGFLTAYPVNWWLLRHGLKEQM